MSTHRLAVLMSLCCVALPSCAVVMAATDAPEVHYQAIGMGSPRRLVIDMLGPPLTSVTGNSGGRLDRYEFAAGIGDRALRATALTRIPRRQHVTKGAYRPHIAHARVFARHAEHLRGLFVGAVFQPP